MGYEVVRRLGRGGMGVVDLATAPDGSPVALKRIALHGSVAEIERARSRIRREAEVLARLDHPALVRLLDVLDDGDDLVLVMPYLAGGSLQERVAAGGPLAPEEVDRLAERLLDGLAAAHRQGIVHRDIKPANVLFDAEGGAYLVDFGVASTRDHTPGLTATEMIVGTPGFMAPEQARGEPATAASDVFSLGATLLYAACGRGPYGVGDVRVLMHRAAGGRVEGPPRALPADQRERLAALLARNPERRPTAAAARGGPAGTDVHAGVRRAVDRHRVATIVAAVLVVLLATAGAVAVLADDDRAAEPGGSAAATTGSAVIPSTTTVPCDSQPYRPCTPAGPGPVAPGTDGRVCLDGFDDFDDDPANGCEAEATGPEPGTELTEDKPTIRANLVPRDTVAEWPVPVGDGFQALCDGQLHLTLRAPAGASMLLVVLDDSTELGRVSAADGLAATVTLTEPECGGNDATTLTARVSWIGSDRTGLPYTLSRRGGW